MMDPPKNQKQQGLVIIIGCGKPPAAAASRKLDRVAETITMCNGRSGDEVAQPPPPTFTKEREREGERKKHTCVPFFFLVREPESVLYTNRACVLRGCCGITVKVIEDCDAALAIDPLDATAVVRWSVALDGGPLDLG